MHPIAQSYPRAGGLFLFVISLVLAKFCIYDPWQEALAHVPSLSLHMKGVVISIVFGELGLGLVIFGDLFRRTMNHPDTGKLTPLGWLLVLAMVVPAFGFYFWFEKLLSGYGYQF